MIGLSLCGLEGYLVEVDDKTYFFSLITFQMLVSVAYSYC